MRRRGISAHAVLMRHPWACQPLMSRFNVGPAMVRYTDSTLGVLREAAETYRPLLNPDEHPYLTEMADRVISAGTTALTVRPARLGVPRLGSWPGAADRVLVAGDAQAGCAGPADVAAP